MKIKELNRRQLNVLIYYFEQTIGEDRHLIEINQDVDLLNFLLDYSTGYAPLIHEKVRNEAVSHRLVMRPQDSLEYTLLQVNEGDFDYTRLSSVEMLHKLTNTFWQDANKIDDFLVKLKDDGWLIALDDRELNGLLILNRIVWGDDTD